MHITNGIRFIIGISTIHFNCTTFTLFSFKPHIHFSGKYRYALGSMFVLPRNVMPQMLTCSHTFKYNCLVRIMLFTLPSYFCKKREQETVSNPVYLNLNIAQPFSKA